MRIWMDALTPKQLLLFSKLASILESDMGAEVMITARKTEEIFRINSLLGNKAILVGTHGRTKFDKLLRDIERMKDLVGLIRDFSPDYLVSYPSPSSVRIAFGLSSKIVLYSDTPHAAHVHLLTVPLSNYLIFSSFIEKGKFLPYVPRGSRTFLLRYKGVEELAWVNGYSPSESSVKRLGLEPYSYVLVRPPEIFASYYSWGFEDFKNLIKELAKKVRVVLVPRYEDDSERYKGTNIEVIGEPMLGLDLEYYSIATISGGGTMSREASLLGVPSISLFPLKLDVDSGLRELGFPLYRALSSKDALRFIYDVMEGNIKRKKIEASKILEHPVIPLKKVLLGDEAI
ncbi:MAG: DUF354 domain-containing protein [Fervidicoccaceae archaeon]